MCHPISWPCYPHFPGGETELSKEEGVGPILQRVECTGALRLPNVHCRALRAPTAGDRALLLYGFLPLGAAGVAADRTGPPQGVLQGQWTYTGSEKDPSRSGATVFGFRFAFFNV